MKITATGRYVVLDVIKESDAAKSALGHLRLPGTREQEKPGKLLKRPYGRVVSIGPKADVTDEAGNPLKIGDIVVYGVCQKVEPQTRDQFVLVVDEHIKCVLSFEASDEAPAVLPEPPKIPRTAADDLVVVKKPGAIAGLAGQVAGR